jgi:putative ABC transport system substrate-binding protein
MDRRRFLLTSLAGAVGRPLAARAQQAGSMHHVGFLSATTVPDLLQALRQGLRERGWIEGQNFSLDDRSAEAKFDQLPEMAADMVRRKVDVIVVSATAIPYIRQATGHVPIVFVIADDPVAAGYVVSLARPRGRMTGLTSLNIELDGKRLEILKAGLPGVTRVGVLATPHDPARSARLAATERAARSMGTKLTIFDVRSAETLPGIFDAAGRAGVGACMVLGSPVFRVWQGQIADLGRNKGIPVVSAWRELPDAGGLMSYGTSVPAMFHRAATYVDRILKGADPGALPVEQAAQFELVVNVKTAKTLGLTIPRSLLVRADHVIE